MLVAIGGVDITPYINPKTYKMNAKKKYDSWEDGNLKEHRIYKRAKIEGSFDVALYGQDGMNTQNFLQTWMNGVDNELATLLVYVQNTNKNEVIEAYFDFEGTFHRELLNGNYVDKMNIKIVER